MSAYMAINEPAIATPTGIKQAYPIHTKLRYLTWTVRQSKDYLTCIWKQTGSLAEGDFYFIFKNSLRTCGPINGRGYASANWSGFKGAGG